ncbi:MAG: hypothetical protein AAGC73_05120 [Verrucomicrobiota bacterium]
MDDGKVRYIFEFDDRELVFDVDTLPVGYDHSREYPEWAKLENNKCACCPLKSADCNYCPVATRIHGLIETFADDKSTEKVKVTVQTPERNYFESCDLQIGINSLLGLLMATSACPVLKKLGSMASFHIPFCTTRETLRRTIGNYLIQQYFAELHGDESDWEMKGLKQYYDVLEGLNRDFSKRVQNSINSDAVSNAVIMFFATSVLVASSLEQQLQRHEKYLTNTE